MTLKIRQKGTEDEFGSIMLAAESLETNETAVSVDPDNTVDALNSNIECTEAWLSVTNAPVRISLDSGVLTPTADVGLYIPASNLMSHPLILCCRLARKMQIIRAN